MGIRKIRTVTTATLLAALVLFVSLPCNLRASAPGASGDATAETLNQQREHYQKGVEDELRQLRQEITALQAKAPRQTDSLRKGFDRQMAELKQKRDLAEQKCETLEKSSQKAWQDMKPGLDAAVKDLQQAYDRAAAEFK